MKNLRTIALSLLVAANLFAGIFSLHDIFDFFELPGGISTLEIDELHEDII